MLNNARQGILRGLVLMTLFSALVVAALGGVNRLAASIQMVNAQPFATIEEARRHIGLAHITMPAYFPEGIAWPPSLLIGQKKPFPAFAMEFRKTGGSDIILIVAQYSGASDARTLQRVQLTAAQEETAYTIKKQPVQLQVGRCSTGAACSQMRWTSNDIQHTVLFVGSPLELIRIAESMIH